MSNVKLRAHLERIVAENDRRYEDRFKAQEKAVDAALVALKDRGANTVWLVGLGIAVLELVLHFWK